MQLARVIETSAAVAGTRSRTEKTALLAQTLREAGELVAGDEPGGLMAGNGSGALLAGNGSGGRAAGEGFEGLVAGDGSEGLVAGGEAPERLVEVVADYLAGTLPQRTVGVGWRGLRSLPDPAPEPSLGVLEVDAALEELRAMAGAGSATTRAAAVEELFARATAEEQRWLVGLITGELRQGAGDGVLLPAIARAADVPDALVRRAVMLAGFPGPVARAALAGGSETLAQICLEVGRPLRPMLAGSAPDVAAALLDDQEVAVETKLDGIRLQIHLDRRPSADTGTDSKADTDAPPTSETETALDADTPPGPETETALDTDTQPAPASGPVRLFTRSLEEITDRLPEVVAAIEALPATTAVLDGEVIALQDDGRPHPFQVTGGRTASSSSEKLAKLATEIPVTTFLFDLLHLDGRDLVDEPAHERWAALHTLAPHLGVDRLVTADPGAAKDFFDDALARGHEGVVVKDPATPYAAGRRGAGWVKVKPRRTADLVVVAVEWGSGRRQGWLSNIHLAARDDRTGELVMVGKTFKGMTDAILAWQTERFLGLETHREGHVVHVRPEQVVEIAYDGVQTSQRYPGGIALRFARVLRYRDDKGADEADTLDALR